MLYDSPALTVMSEPSSYLTFMVLEVAAVAGHQTGSPKLGETSLIQSNPARA